MKTHIFLRFFLKSRSTERWAIPNRLRDQRGVVIEGAIVRESRLFVAQIPGADLTLAGGG
jgi:hypothetical protein